METNTDLICSTGPRNLQKEFALMVISKGNRFHDIFSIVNSQRRSENKRRGMVKQTFEVQLAERSVMIPEEPGSNAADRSFKKPFIYF